MRGRRSARALGAAAATALLATILTPGTALACSPPPRDYRDDFHFSDAAFTGTLLEREAVAEYEVDLTFQVDEDYKGTLGETVVVRSPAHDGICGLGVSVGDRISLFAYENDEGRLTSHYPLAVSREVMQATMEPLPGPDGVGKAVTLVGGSFGETRVLALDKRGRVLGYGYGEGDATKLSVCPGSHFLAEAVRGIDGLSVSLRSLDDLAVESETSLPDGFVTTILCDGNHGRRTLIAYQNFEDERMVHRVLRLKGDAWIPVYEGAWPVTDLRPNKALLIVGGSLEVHRFANGTEHQGLDPIAGFDSSIYEARWSSSGEYIAGSTYGYSSEDRVIVFVVRPDGVISRRLSAETTSAPVRWDGDRRFVATNRGLVYNTDLDRLGSVGSWRAMDGAAYDRWLYGVEWGLLTRNDLSGGGADVFQRFFSPITYALAPIPGGAEIDAPPHS